MHDPLTGTGCTSVDIVVNANLELVDKFCYLGDMLSVDGDADAAVETEFKLDGINSGSWFRCLPITWFVQTVKTVFQDFPGLAKTKFQGFPGLTKLVFKDFPG